ncbi:MAG: diadenylate cyclase CdaA [Bryobacteraceae bacterium]
MTLPKIDARSAADILITAFLIYQLLIIIKGRRAAQVLLGLSVLFGFYMLAVWFNLTMLQTIMETVAPYTVFGLIVMFQSEIRRMLAQLGRRSWVGFGGSLKRREFVEEILLALDHLSRHKIGALIVLERYSGLKSFVETGVPLDANVSTDLLLAIFQPKAPLHDGAVIVQNERIAGAACFLPLSMNPALVSTMGTRHRAAIGVTEETDCLSLVVSEETGTISAAAFGVLTRDLTLEQAAEKIAAHMGGKSDPAKTTAEPSMVDAEPSPRPEAQR